jgi:hypothetical protein
MGMIMGLVMQGMTVVIDVTGIYVNQGRALNFTPRNLLLDILMVSVITALLEGGSNADEATFDCP